MQARHNVEASCDGIPKPWPKPANSRDYTAEEAERYARRDRNDSLRCAGAGLTYADHIRRRDTKLSGKR